MGSIIQNNFNPATQLIYFSTKSLDLCSRSNYVLKLNTTSFNENLASSAAQFSELMRKQMTLTALPTIDLTFKSVGEPFKSIQRFTSITATKYFVIFQRSQTSIVPLDLSPSLQIQNKSEQKLHLPVTSVAMFFLLEEYYKKFLRLWKSILLSRILGDFALI